MEAIPAMPVTPAQVPNAAAARDAKGSEPADTSGFGDALKDEIASRSSDAKDVPADEAATDAPADEKADDTAAADAPALDPAVAALLGEPSAQQTAAALAAQGQIQPQTVTPQQPAVDAAATDAVADATIAETAPAGVRGARAESPGEQRVDERSVRRGRGGAERAGVDKAGERAPAERSTLERIAVERGAERGASERALAERPVTAEHRSGELRAVRDGGDRPFVAGDKSATDTPGASFQTGFTVDRFASAADAPVPVAASAPTLDSLSAGTLGTKWGASAAGTGADAVGAAPTATARVDTPLGLPGWGDAFQQKVVWMVDRQLERAELHINPQHLGPVDVMLDMTGDGAQIAFTSPHAAVREAIESTLPDLRNALDARGLSLGQASVGADSGAAREQFAEQAREAARNAHPGRSGGSEPVVEARTPARAAIVRRGLVDTFA
ncbi:MAG TPA: flagellar hook-length control protein FliK [Burkholderiales bacterium]|nr:flagellar hook-length control protein FliK [Burkholderiales bacterium]